jgi:hypothetical protein
VLSYAALTDGITPDAVVSRVLGLVPAPQLDLAGTGTAGATGMTGTTGGAGRGGAEASA